jgi:uncharacterized lipoprotein
LQFSPLGSLKGEEKMDGLSITKPRNVLIFLLVVFLFLLFCATKNRAAKPDKEVTILVTAIPHNDRTRSIADKLQSLDFDVPEENRSQKIISVKKAKKEQIMFGVMTGYITMGSLKVRQQFTKDKKAAMDSFRILLSSEITTPSI